MIKIHLKQVYFQVIFAFIYRILCDWTFNRGSNSNINDIMCVMLGVTLLKGNYFGIKEMDAPCGSTSDWI